MIGLTKLFFVIIKNLLYLLHTQKINAIEFKGKEMQIIA